MDSKPDSLNGASSGESVEAAALGGTNSMDNPFVGLRPFESAESLLFFGRREQIMELLQLLHRSRFLAIVGSSGCGKSSLIRAGLIPKLKAGFLAGRRDQWRIATMKPGDAPLQNLASALLEALSDDSPEDHVASFTDRIREGGSQAIVDYLSAQLSKSNANILLLVDQFEEIFRFGLYTEKEAQGISDDKEERRDEAADFVSLMLALSEQESLPVFVVMTMRSDFLGDCDAFYNLPEAMNRSQYLVPRLTRRQRQEAIESPIRLYGADIAPRLVDRVLNDAGDESDQLPVMQHALLRTWEKWRRQQTGPIDISHYEAIGTVKEALSIDADKAVEGMSKEELFITERLFQALTDTDVKGRRLRRPAHLSEIEAITGAGREEILGIIERFRSSNRSFLTISQDHIANDPLIDISHESLIRQWKTLRAWTDAEAEWKELYLRLAGDAVRFDKGQVPLWSDPALQVALDWRTNRQPNEAWGRRYHPGFQHAIAFLEKSEGERANVRAEAEHLREEAARKEREEYERAQQYAEQQKAFALKQAATARRLRRFAAALAVICLLAVSAAALAAYALRKAKENEDKAERAKNAIRLNREALKAWDAVKIEEAVKLFEEAANAFKEIQDTEGEAYAYIEIADMLIDQGDKLPGRYSTERTRGLGYLGKASVLYRMYKDHNGSAATLIRMGEYFLGNNKRFAAAGENNEETRKERKYNLNTGLKNFCAARKDYETAGNFEGQIQTLIRIGDLIDEAQNKLEVEGCAGRLDEKPVDYYEQTIPLYDALLQTPAKSEDEMKSRRYAFVSMLSKIGAIYFNNDSKRASERFDQAVDVYRKAGDLDGQVSILFDYAARLEEGELKDSYYKRATQVYHDAKQDKKEAETFVQLGDVYREKARLRRSPINLQSQYTQKQLEYYQQASQIFQSIGARKEQANVLIGIGSALNVLTQFDKALESYQSALKIYEEDGSVLGQAAALNGIGRAQAGLTQYEQAIESYTRAKQLYLQANDNRAAEMEGRIKGLQTKAGQQKSTK
jgi:tetratricopeptide (TPR) repeat protein